MELKQRRGESKDESWGGSPRVPRHALIGQKPGAKPRKSGEAAVGRQGEACQNWMSCGLSRARA